MDELYDPIPVEYLLARGVCCGNECCNCPFVDDEGNRFQAGCENIDETLVAKLQKETPLQ